MSPRPNIAIVGATGAVGCELLSILEQRSFPIGSMRLFASPRSAGQKRTFAGREITIEALAPGCFRGTDIALFSAGSGPTKEWAPRAVEDGATVIDNSSAYRMTPGVPLVVPEINAEALNAVRGKPAIIANPNCSTIIMLMGLDAVRRRFGISKINVATYQAVSGAGAAAIDELVSQARDVLDDKPARPSIFHEPCAFNVFSHNSAMDLVTGRNVEEQKMVDETRKIWSDPEILINATCVRVPVVRAHAEAITVTLKKWASEAAIRACYEGAPGVTLVDDRKGNRFPTSLKATGGDDTLVGRIRPDETQGSRPDPERAGETQHEGFNFFVASDQIRKGAALNAIQIAEELLKKR